MFADDQEAESLNKISCCLLNDLALQISHQPEFTNIFGEVVRQGHFYVASQVEGFPKSLENSSRENPKSLSHYFGLKKFMIF